MQADDIRDDLSEARYDGDDDRETEFIARWSSVSESEGEDVP